ncbi:MAG: NDP-sugar synthase [Candidatus Aenigmatarchaeota archaeon]|nr:NDP-sugar synthase [Candidatus Aenigmarchaeota archaeon]
MEAIILTGGSGKRLLPLTKDIPKCMLKVNGKPLLDYHVKWLKQYGVEKIVLACRYKWENIKRHYGDMFIYSVEKEPLGTGGAVKHALKYIENENFFLVNADDITDVDLNKLKKMGSNTIVLSRFHSNFGIVETKGNKVINFKQKPLLPYWAWCGVALLNKNIPLPDKGAIETETFPKIDLKAFKHKGFWMTVNTAKDLEELENVAKKINLFK